jgi:hypothetical protein
MLRKSLVLASLCALTSACASQFATRYVGKDVVDLELENGKPANILVLPDGRRSYQYRWGGGTFVTPQTTTGTARVAGDTMYVQAQTTPAIAVSSQGCLINFIAEQRGQRWIVVEGRWPDQLVC